MLVPRIEYGAHDLSPVDFESMDGGPMRVTVDHPAYAAVTHESGDGVRVHVHDLGRDTLHMRAAPGARGAREQCARGQWQREHPSLPVRRAHRRAQLLVVVIIRAEQIPVRQQHALAIEFGDAGIRQQAAAAAPLEPFAEQEITVTDHHEAGYAGRREFAQRDADPLAIRVRIVIADPAFEQITAAQQADELLDRGGRSAIQVQVGDEQDHPHMIDERRRHRPVVQVG